MTTETSFPVRYAETDQMGIVHHSVYPIWFECGRTEHVKHFGFTYAGLEAAGALLPLIRLTCEYNRAMHYGESAHVRTRLVRCGKSRMVFGYTVHASPDGPVCASGFTEHVWTGKDLKPVNLSRRYPDLFAEMTAMFQAATGE